MRAAVLGPDRKPMSIPELMAKSGWAGGPPELPERVKLWVRSELMDA